MNDDDDDIPIIIAKRQSDGTIMTTSGTLYQAITFADKAFSNIALAMSDPNMADYFTSDNIPPTAPEVRVKAIAPYDKSEENIAAPEVRVKAIAPYDKSEENIAATPEDNSIAIIQASNGIAIANSLQHAIASYPAIKHVFKILGAELPDISISSVMIPLQIFSAIQRVGHTLPAYDANNKPYDSKMMIINTFSLINYMTKFAVSKAFNNPMLQQNSNKTTPDNLAQLCVAHGLVHILIDDLMSVVQTSILGNHFTLEGIFLSNSPSILYGTTFTVVNCAKNSEAELSPTAKTISTISSFAIGGILGYCLYAPMHNIFDIFNNLVKISVGIATANKIVNAVFAANTMEGEYFYNKAPEDHKNDTPTKINITADSEVRLGGVSSINANYLETAEELI